MSYHDKSMVHHYASLSAGRGHDITISLLVRVEPRLRRRVVVCGDSVRCVSALAVIQCARVGKLIYLYIYDRWYRYVFL